jgi:hypothetical protein
MSITLGLRSASLLALVAASTFIIIKFELLALPAALGHF